MRCGAGVLSAGHGSRFKEAGERRPKPLVEVAGRPLLGWTLEAFQDAGFRSAAILFNSTNAVARTYAKEAFPRMRLKVLVRDTASTLESFCVLSGALREPWLLLSTVDAVYAPGALARFLSRASKRSFDLALGVTGETDATSLRVRTDRRGWAVSLEKGGTGPVATAGVYLVGPRSRKAAKAALAEGCPSLSRFLASCPGLGLRTAAIDMGTVYDVDRPRDVRAAARGLA